MTIRGIRASRSNSSLSPAPCVGFGEVGDPLGGGSERDSVTAAGCLDSEGDGEVCFAGSEDLGRPRAGRGLRCCCSSGVE